MQSSQRPVSAQVSAVPVGWRPVPEVRYPRAEGLDHVAGREVEDGETWGRLLRSPAPLRGLRLQAIDLTRDRELLLAREDLSDLVVLGGRLDEEVEEHLRAHDSVIFPSDPRAPVNPYRATLYTPQELYAGLDESGYAATVDARAYRWFEDATVRHDAYVSALRAIHDDAMADALAGVVSGRRVVGVMGGHALRRGSDEFAAAALLGHRVAEAGALVLTGGGPGAMEAANLGAWATDEQVLAESLHAVAAVPDFAADISDWVRPALALRGQGLGGRGLRSVGIPTWYYGHEPPNAFAQLIAKFFSNAVREDLLLAHSRDGLVVLPGAAGTVQEVFQMATRLYYEVDLPGRPLPPLVLVGRSHWTDHLPVWPLLQALGRHRAMGEALHLVDTVDEAAALVAPADRGQPLSATLASVVATTPTKEAIMTTTRTDPQWEPPLAGTDAEHAVGTLERLRATFRWKADGLDVDQLRAQPVPTSDLSVGGLLKHLAVVEDDVFCWRMAGQPPVTWMSVPEEDVARWQFSVDPDESAESVYALWEAAVARSRATLQRLLADGGLDQPGHLEYENVRPSVRRHLHDLIEEYGRHTGHMDLLREAVDGRVGEDPPGDWPMIPAP